MREIKWIDLLIRNGLSIKQLEDQILAAAAAVAAIKLDKHEGDEDTFIFYCTDDVGDIQLTARRVKGDQA